MKKNEILINEQPICDMLEIFVNGKSIAKGNNWDSCFEWDNLIPKLLKEMNIDFEWSSNSNFKFKECEHCGE